MKNKFPMVTIIIPLYAISERFFEDFKKFELIDYPRFEIIVVCDKKVQLPKLKKIPVTLLLTKQKKTGPAEKRDLALKKAKGMICAFIDDDAYPDPDWLKNAARDFQKEDIAAIGGPGLTPPEDTYWEQLTGHVYSSFFCGGLAQYRFVKGKRQYVDDYPAYNLLVRTDVLKKVGGYGSYFYGGEDTFLCLKLIQSGHKILYDPKVVVYHHRRALFVPYLKQIANVGLHRGYFAKKFPETSRKFFYFIPSLLSVSFFVLLFISFINTLVAVIFFGFLLLFLLLAFLSVVKQTSFFNAIIVSIGIMLTHLAYGLYFIKGLGISKLDR